jgi:O-antigen/teichoic acid export membrane protein
MTSGKKYHQWIRSGMYGGLQKVSVMLFGVFSTMLLAHKAITPQQMGVWSLFLVITSFVEIFRHGLVKNSLIKYLNSGKADERGLILSSAVWLNICITFLTGLLLVVSAEFFSRFIKAPQLAAMIYIFSAGLLFLIPFSHFEWIMIARLNFRGIFLAYLIRQGVTLLLLAGFVIFKQPVTLNLLVIFFCTGIACGAVAGTLLNRDAVSFKLRYSPEWIKRLWHFGKYAFGTGLSNLVFRSSDQFMVSNLLSPATVALKAVALQGISVRIFNLTDMPSQVIGDILFPKSAALASHETGRIKYYYERSVGATLSIILPAILFILAFPKLIILALAGPQYMEAVPYLRLLVISSIFLAFLKQFGTITDGTGHPKINFMMTTGIALINLVFCYFLIRRYGLMGAAYGLLCTHIIAFAVSQFILTRLYQVKFLNSFKYAFGFYPELFKIIRKKLTRP